MVQLSIFWGLESPDWCKVGSDTSISFFKASREIPEEGQALNFLGEFPEPGGICIEKEMKTLQIRGG